MTTTSHRPAVLRAAARGPLGLTALQLAMCARARKHEPRPTPFRDSRGRPAGACVTPGVAGDCHGLDRLLALAAPALREITSGGAPGRPPSMPPPLVLAVPEPGRPDDDPRLDGAFLQALAAASGAAIDSAHSRTVRAGHAGFAFALSEAIALLARGADEVLVGGVDSYHHPEVIAWLDREHRLHALGVEDGFVPGEGAAFLRIARDAPRGAALARVAAVETGREESVLSDAPNIGAAMTKILARIAAAAPGGAIAWALPDLNGERHRTNEWTLCTRRGALSDGCVEERLANELGDTGAASGALLAAVACELLHAPGAPARAACIALHAEGAERGAFLLASAEEGT